MGIRGYNKKNNSKKATKSKVYPIDFAFRYNVTATSDDEAQEKATRQFLNDLKTVVANVKSTEDLFMEGENVITFLTKLAGSVDGGIVRRMETEIAKDTYIPQEEEPGVKGEDDAPEEPAEIGLRVSVVSGEYQNKSGTVTNFDRETNVAEVKLDDVNYVVCLPAALLKQKEAEKQ